MSPLQIGLESATSGGSRLRLDRNSLSLPIVRPAVLPPFFDYLCFSCDAQVTYSRDQMGQITAIDGTGYAGFSQSVSGIKYEIQQLTVLHGIAHAFDPKGTWDDKDDTAKVAALNRAIRKACF